MGEWALKTKNTKNVTGHLMRMTYVFILVSLITTQLTVSWFIPAD